MFDMDQIVAWHVICPFIHITLKHTLYIFQKSMSFRINKQKKNNYLDNNDDVEDDVDDVNLIMFSHFL